MNNRQECLSICENSLKKYLSQDQGFDVDHSIMMLECHIICQNQLKNETYGDIICFFCASICVDCLDPEVSKEHDEISRKFKLIHHYVRKSTDNTKGVNDGVTGILT